MRFLTRLGCLFPRSATVEIVQTTIHFDAPPEAVWRAMRLYEDVARRPSPLLRLVLPIPIRTRGDKTQAGSTVECLYEGGYLEKRITRAERPRFVGFDVIVQQLGIEDAISMRAGSYEINASGHGSDVVVTTTYSGHLRPRWLWRLVERFLARGVHRHILEGMRAVLEKPPGATEPKALPT